MIDFGPIDELREIRRRLSEQCGNDIERYAAMLAEVATRIPGKYITHPLAHDSSPVSPCFEKVDCVPAPCVSQTPVSEHSTT